MLNMKIKYIIMIVGGFICIFNWLKDFIFGDSYAVEARIERTAKAVAALESEMEFGYDIKRPARKLPRKEVI